MEGADESTELRRHPIFLKLTDSFFLQKLIKVPTRDAKGLTHSGGKTLFKLKMHIKLC